MVEVHYAQDFVQTVGRFGELGVKEVLLCCEHFEVVGIAVLHQQLGVPYCSLKVYDLFFVDVYPFLGRFPHCECIVYFDTCIEKALAEKVCSLFVLCLCSLETGLVGMPVEDGLCEGCYKIGYEASRVKHDTSVA